MDSKEALQNLNFALKRGKTRSFLMAVRRVAERNGGMSQLARASRLSRESLYRMLSHRGNPEMKSLSAVLKAVGFRLCVCRDGH